jgi:hypothetical protein
MATISIIATKTKDHVVIHADVTEGMTTTGWSSKGRDLREALLALVDKLVPASKQL